MTTLANLIEKREKFIVPETVYWEQYYNNNDETTYEWNNGLLEVKPETLLMYEWFLRRLDHFLMTYPILRRSD